MKENADKARNLDTAELNKQLHDMAEQKFRLRFQMSMGQMEGLKKFRSLKKERARMLTVLRERELHREPPPKKESHAPVAGKAAKPKPAAKAKAKVKVKAAPKPAAKKAAAAPKAKAHAKPKAAPKARKSSKG
jgi:large subunit ribosomal protein L29